MKPFYFLSIILLLTKCSTPKLEISQIAFEADGCFGTCPAFTMTILNDGTANYNAKMYNERQGQFKTVIKKAQLDSLITLIEKTNVFDLKDNYSTLMTDQTTYTLKVKLKNGQTKSIEDYGHSGPDKLEKIYNLLFSLRETQDWK